MGIEFVRLPEVDSADIIDLMSGPAVRRHLPLASGPFGDPFGDIECAAFVAAKERIWTEHGYGPWGFVADGAFVGWGGPQPEDGDIDIALVLGRPAWGLGELIHREILRRVFDAVAPESVTALLPATRGSAHALLRLGYAPDGAAEIGGHPFHRYRLRPPKKLSSLKRGCHATGRGVGVPRVGNR
jgi:ribosomal-protein-alanine N-acetyltransferase